MKLDRTLLLTCILLFLSAQSGAQSDSIIRQRMQQTPNNLGIAWKSSARKYVLEGLGPEKNRTEQALSYSTYYFPVFDSILRKEGLPGDLKFVALALSGLQFDYFDTLDGARGIWHCNYQGAKLFNLKITSYVDERLDPVRSAMAFSQAMKQYHRLYKDWKLAVAAWVSSAPKVNKAIHYHGDTTDYWKIREDLEPVASAIVERMLASMYLYHHGSRHQLKMKRYQPPVAAANIPITDWLSMELVAIKSGVPVETLRFLNPAFKRGIIPDLPDTFYFRVPQQLRDSTEWLQKLKYEPYDAYYFNIKPPEIIYDTLEHEVKAGETLESIAEKYKVKKSEIEEWNELEGDDISEGQTLLIIREKVKQQAPPKPNPSYRVYTVRSGDTLSGIASRYRCRVSDIKRWNNLSSNTIYPGQKLRIY